MYIPPLLLILVAVLLFGSIAMAMHSIKRESDALNSEAETLRLARKILEQNDRLRELANQACDIANRYLSDSTKKPKQKTN